MICYQSDKVEKPQQYGGANNFHTPFLHILGSLMILVCRQNSTGLNQAKKNHTMKLGKLCLGLYQMVLQL